MKAYQVLSVVGTFLLYAGMGILAADGPKWLAMSCMVVSMTANVLETHLRPERDDQLEAD